MMIVNHCPCVAALEPGSRSCSAGFPMRGKRPISNPSKSQPRKAAIRAAMAPLREGCFDESIGSVLVRQASYRPLLPGAKRYLAGTLA